MPADGKSLAEKVQKSYLELSVVAFDLNGASDELGTYIAEIDAALKKLSLGIAVWVRISGWSDEHQTLDFYHEDIGYGKIDGKWGIALRTVSGNYQDPEGETSEEWLFNDGPRRIRLAAIEKVPELLNELSKEAVKTSQKIQARLAEVKEVAEAVKTAASGVPQETAGRKVKK